MLLALFVVLLLVPDTGLLRAFTPGCLIFGYMYLVRSQHLNDVPGIYIFLFSLSLLMNCLGWMLDFYQAPGLFDELAHGFTSLVVTLIFGHTICRPWRKGGEFTRLDLANVALLVTGWGAIWEVLEWIVWKVQTNPAPVTLDDTVVDLIYDFGGNVIAALILAKEKSIFRH